MKKIAFFYSLLILLSACSILVKKPGKVEHSTVKPDTLKVAAVPIEPAIYRETKKRINDLLHTKLEVKFDYEKTYLYGKATLTLTPYFYPTNTLTLDAKGFDILNVSLLKGKEALKDLQYKYDGLTINIAFDSLYNRLDTFQVYIEYTAKPNDLEAGGSVAITSDKGLYFINPDGKEQGKPIQIWTQGETEASSCWFPTIDSPNEKMTQEIYMTVQDKYITLSNGVLMFSLDNGDGTRTDYWKQDLQHAPYLAMMAVGEFAVIKDTWRDLDVHYFVEKEYEPYAKEIFGNTPEMLEFYSNKLGVDYPWDKYHQIVVRDYVSGAMENTGAVIFGEFMHKTSRELLDDENESIIAHELFHHWFGDLVTSESWANLPLNESFATYGEYLWIEYKYGRDAADHHIQGNLAQYLMESKQKQVDMIRFDYEDKEDMFDSHSYAKGGRILHMLRKYVGDDAFFKSLELYLKTHQFDPVEIHDLRLVFEKITGEDLNWFFNQWFFASGHPEVTFITSYDEISKEAIVAVEQNHNFEKTPLYRLPLMVDIYVNGKVERHTITPNQQWEEFTFKVNSKPDLINVDAEKMLLGVKKEKKKLAEWAFQYRHAPLYLDRYEAVENLANYGSDSLSALINAEALNDEFWSIRALAIKNTRNISSENKTALKNQLITMMQKDPKSDVRAAAIKTLSLNFKDVELLSAFKDALKDSSYVVASEALSGIDAIDEKEAMKVAKTMEKENNTGILLTIAAIYSKSGSETENDFFLSAYQKMTGFNKYTFTAVYSKYLKGLNDETINSGLVILEDAARQTGPWWMRLGGLQALTELHSMYKKREFDLNEELKKVDLPASEMATIQQESNVASKQKEKVLAILRSLKETETDKNLARLLETY